MASSKKAAKKAPARKAVAPAPAPAPVAAEAPAPAPAPAAPTLVTIKATGPMLVIVESIGDRERHENGKTLVPAGTEWHAIVGPMQSVRIAEGG